MKGLFDGSGPKADVTTRTFVPPMPAEDVLRLSKRERLEIVKPILRSHQEERNPDQVLRERGSFEDHRWSWIYHALGEPGLHSRGLLGQARSEIECEGEYGHYWQPAWSTLRVIEDGWHRYEAEVNFPRRIRHGKDEYERDITRRFRCRKAAERWIARQTHRYERYILRLLAEGLYDEWGYE